MDLISSIAVRSQKGYYPLKDKISNRETVNFGNIVSINRIFIDVDIRVALPGASVLQIFCNDSGDTNLFNRMPIKVNGEVHASTFVSISAIGKYRIEFDASLYRTGILTIQVGGGASIDFDDYLVCRVVATEMLSITTPEPKFIYDFPSQTLKKTFVPLTQTVLKTGQARTVIVELTPIGTPPTSPPYAEFRIEDTSRPVWLEGFDSLDNAVSSPFNWSSANGYYIRLTQTGTIYVYFDVTDISEIRFVYSTSLMNISVRLIEDAISKANDDEPTAYDVPSQRLKEEIAMIPNGIVKTGLARTLVLEATTLVPLPAPTNVEITVFDSFDSSMLPPYDSMRNSEISALAITEQYVRIREDGTYLIYYDVSRTASAEIRFRSDYLSITAQLLEEPLDILFDEIHEVVYDSKSFVVETTKRSVYDCNRKTFIFGWDSFAITIGINGYSGATDRILFNNTVFPNLKAGSVIAYAYVLPVGSLDRICVITNKNQVYHNYPYRSTTGQGTILDGDHKLFDESAIWDLPTNVSARRHPSNDPSESRAGYKYFPYLPAYSYNITPGINQDNGYGNGGYPDQLINGSFVRSRFYDFKERSATSDNPFDLIRGGLTKTPKLSTIGNYQLNGSRVCLFATDDGGRNWYVTYEFDSYVSFGNTINAINAGEYIAGSFAIQERLNIFPDDTVKEPVNSFSFNPEIVVTNISNTNPAVVTTAVPHGMVNTPSDKPLIRFVRKTAGSDGLSQMLNDGASEINPTAGTGVYLRVNVLSDTTFEIHENIYNPSTNLKCRHIHFTHPMKDFVAFGTGENYPYTWTMLLENKLIDGSAVVQLHLRNPLSYRLNSSPKGIQRPCSFWMLDDDSENPTVFCGSDTNLGYRGDGLVVPGRTNLPARSSAGILKGKLSDIDDTSKWVSVLDIAEPNIYCMNLNNVLVAGFQLGSNAVSFDLGETWELLKMGSQLRIAWVDDHNIIYLRGGYRLRLKP